MAGLFDNSNMTSTVFGQMPTEYVRTSNIARKRRREKAYEAAGVDLHAAAYQEMSKEQLARLAAHEAKIANQRMRRLEKAGYGGQAPASKAYEIVTSDISRWFPGRQKFSETAATYEKMRISRIRAILRDFDYYKTLKTATVAGTRKSMKTRREQFEKKTGIKFRDQEQYDRFWKSGVGTFFFESIGSPLAMKMIQRNSTQQLDKIIRDTEKWLAKDNGDKDDADKIAKLLGYKDMKTARRIVEPKKKKSGKKKKAAAKSVGKSSLKRAAERLRK